jgi:DNA-binding NarL/FixJ family response regulator
LHGSTLVTGDVRAEQMPVPLGRHPRPPRANANLGRERPRLLEPVTSAVAVSVALVAHERLTRDAIARMLDSMVDLALSGAFASAGALLASAPAGRAEVALMDCDGEDREQLEDELDELAARAPQLKLIVLCSGECAEQLRCSLEHRVPGVLLDCGSPAQLHSAIRCVARGHAVLPADWRARVAHVAAPAVGRLTVRQSQVLAMVAAGQANHEIAQRLQITDNTVKAHVSAIYQRLGVSNRIQAANRHATLIERGAQRA